MSNLLAKKINYRIAHTFVELKVVDSGAPAKNDHRPRRDINSLLARLKQLIKRVSCELNTNMYNIFRNPFESYLFPANKEKEIKNLYDCEYIQW